MRPLTAHVLPVRALAAALALLPLAACGGHDRGPGAAGGTGNARSYTLAGFTDVGLTGPDDASISIGPAFSVRAQGDAAVLDRLAIERSGSTLKIGRRSGMSTDAGVARVFVTMPAIEGASVAGSGDMTIDKVTGDAMAMQVSGSGSLAAKDLAVKRAQVSISGSGNVSAAGTTQMLTVRVAGSGNLDAGDLKASGAEISVAGSGSVKAAVAGQARVKVMGSGDVDLGPDATCETSTMGTGEVRCGK